MPLSELTRVCAICHGLIPAPPAAAVCERCGQLAAPHFTTWPAVDRWWMLSELASRRPEWVSEQRAWEDRLRGALVGTTLAAPNPWGLPISLSTPTIELLTYAHERALAWKAAGSPIAVHVPFRRIAA